MVKDAEQEEVISANTSYCALKSLECMEPKSARVDTANTNGGSAAHPVALPLMAPSVQEACLICLGFELSQESGRTREHTRHHHACVFVRSLRRGRTLAQFVGDHQGWVPCNILAESLVVPSVAQQNDEEVELWDLVTDDLRHE